MSKKELIYGKSRFLFPCIGVSGDRLLPGNFGVIIGENPLPIVFFSGRKLFGFGKTEDFSVDWMGDFAVYRFSDRTFFAVGIADNFLMGFGNAPVNFYRRGVSVGTRRFYILHPKGKGSFDSEGLVGPVADYYRKILELCDNSTDCILTLLELPVSRIKKESDRYERAGNNKNKRRCKTEVSDGFIGAGRFFSEIPNYSEPPGIREVVGNIVSLFGPAIEWKYLAPGIGPEEYSMLWKDLWVIHRVNLRGPLKPFEKSWVTPCRAERHVSEIMSVTSTLNIIEDLKWYRPDLAMELIEGVLGLIRFSDGMMPHRCRIIDRRRKIRNRGGVSYKVTLPPLWCCIILEFMKYFPPATERSHSIFTLLERNIKWWEEHRYFPEYGLFGFNTSPRIMAEESDSEGSPRFYMVFDGDKWKKVHSGKCRKLITADLNAQMADYYQSMGVLGFIAGSDRYNEYFSKAERIIENVQNHLWDDDYSFFFDLDPDTGHLQPIFSSSAFWTLFGGCVEKNRLGRFLEHLTDPEKFWTELPLPDIAVNDPFHKFDMCSSSVRINRIFWTVRGLERYDKGDLAAELSIKTIDYLNRIYMKYGKIYEFYSPRGASVRAGRFRKVLRPYPYHMGYNPIHALFYYGVLGAEILDDGINFIPKDIIGKSFRFELYYNGKKYGYETGNERTLIEIPREEEQTV